MNSLSFDIVDEHLPGEKFKRLFDLNWPAYQAWYLDEGEAARPTYLECITAFKQYMPELYPLYQNLLKLLDCNDIQARFLSLYCPPPFYSGCSQLISKNERKALIRNYDFPPILCEGIVLRSQWMDKKIIAMTDCVWGVLDGMNDSGLAVSVAYGGQQQQGVGFGITIVLRYVLETCASVEQAIDVFQRIPIHLDYNIALLDKHGQHATLFISPREKPCVSRATTSANHQGPIDTTKKVFLADSQIRLDALNALSSATQQSQAKTISQFLYPPLYRSHALNQSGTLYTAAYFPEEGEVNYLWPQQNLILSFDNYCEQNIFINYQ